MFIDVQNLAECKKCKWLFIKHSTIYLDEIKKSLAKIPKNDIWFKQESMIIHICCRNIESAQKMLVNCQQAGLKRAGIVTIGKRIMIEAFGTDRMDTIIAQNGNILVEEDYLKILIEEANLRHKRNLEKIKKFTKKTQTRIKWLLGSTFRH